MDPGISAPLICPCLSWPIRDLRSSAIQAVVANRLEAKEGLHRAHLRHRRSLTLGANRPTSPK